MQKILLLAALLMTSIMSWADDTDTQTYAEEISGNTLTITVNAAGGLYSWTQTLGGGNSSENKYSSVNYVKIKTEGDVKLSYPPSGTWETSGYDLPAVSSFTTTNFPAIKGIDFSDANFDDDGYVTIASQIPNNGNVKIDIVLKRGTSAEDLNTIYTQINNYTWNIGNLYSQYTNEIFIARYVHNNDSHFADGANICPATCKNLVVMGNVDATAITAINSYSHAQNLILMEGSTSLSSTDFSPIQNNIKRVILPVDTDVSNSTLNFDNSSIKVVQACQNESGTTPSSTDIRLLEAGALKDVAHYRNSTINDAYYMKFNGFFNNDDLDFIENINNDKFDLSGITYTASDKGIEADWNNLKFNTEYSGSYPTLYVLLPDFGKNPKDSLFNSIRSNNGNRISIGHYYADGKFFTSYSQNEGDVVILTSMLDKRNEIERAKLSGKLCAHDMTNQQIGCSLENGHLMFDAEASENANGRDNRNLKGTAISKYAFGKGLIELNLADATFTNAEDITFTRLGILSYSETEKVVLPTDKDFKVIPAHCLNTAFTKMTSLHIPSNIEEIRTSAFYNWNSLSLITTDDVNGKLISYGYGKAQKPDGTDYTDVDDENAGSYVFSANLKKIEGYAFTLAYRVKDVYCLGTTAPECHKNAFSSQICAGDGGYDPQGVITRKDYRKKQQKNPDEQDEQYRWIAVLHFPANCDETNTKRYTDVTRDYSIADSDGTLDERGKLLYWPNQAEFIRSYVQGTNGMLWNAWSSKREDHTYGLSSNAVGTSEEQAASNERYNTDGGTAESVFYDTSYIKEGNTVAGVTEDYDKAIYDKDYRGWHQFVLTNYGTSKEGTYTPQFSFDITDDNWWTICLPFDMTKADLLDIFGGENKEGDNRYPDVRELVGVTRNASTRTITLNFGENIVLTKTEGGATDENDVIIKAGHPYLIKPAVAGGTNKAFPRESAKAMKNDELENLLTNNMVTVTALDENNKETGYKYTFIGNFYKWYIPQYSYFLGWDSRESKPAFFYHNEMVADRWWNPYTAVIAPNWDNPTIITPDGDKETIHWYTSNKDVSVLNDDSFEISGSAQGARPYSIVMDFGNSTVTGITEVDTENKTGKTATRVYTLNGQYIGTSTESLPKGIYIVDGKKTIIY